MFSINHFVWIGLCIVFVTAMTIISLKHEWKLKKSGYVMTVICTFSEVSKVMSNMTESPNGGMHLDPLSLPFHLCSLMIFAVLFITFGKEGRAKRLTINFVSVMGILGSFCAIMIPTNGTDFTTFPAYQCFIYHAGLMWFALYLIFSGEAKPTIKSMAENMVILSILIFIMLYVNGALSGYDANFFYLTRPPIEGLSYLNLNHGWYAYLGRMLLLGTILILLFHMPFIIKERKSGILNTAKNQTELNPLESDDVEQFIKKNQEAFNCEKIDESGNSEHN